MYHKTKEDAQAVSIQYQDLFHVKFELEPNKGWVIVLHPKTIGQYSLPFQGLLDKVEVDLGYPCRLGSRLAREAHVKPTGADIRDRLSAAIKSGGDTTVLCDALEEIWRLDDLVI